MATQTINGITLKYPNEPCMVFNPCIFSLTGAMARARVFVNYGGQNYQATYQIPDGGILDLRQFLQVMFSDLQIGKNIDYTAMKVSELGKLVNITIIALDESSTSLAQFNLSIFCLWGGTGVNENYGGLKNIKWFRYFPLTVGVYAGTAGSIVVGDNEAVTIPASPSVVNVPISSSLDEFTVERSLSRSGHIVWVREYTITADDTDEGIYLRWVDRFGMWRYWLFKAGDPTRQAASRFGLWYHNNYADYDEQTWWQGGSGRRQSFTRTDIQPICAPLVTQEEFDMLQDITTSPAVDMYIGGRGASAKWTAVTIEAGQYTKDVKKPEQDFICNLVLPEIPTQTL
jgi:hypothetical protein